MSEDYTFQIVMKDGTYCAEVSGPDREAVLREAMHYAAVYGQDGPVSVLEVTSSGNIEEFMDD